VKIHGKRLYFSQLQRAASSRQVPWLCAETKQPEKPTGRQQCRTSTMPHKYNAAQVHSSNSAGQIALNITMFALAVSALPTPANAEGIGRYCDNEVCLCQRNCKPNLNWYAGYRVAFGKAVTLSRSFQTFAHA
jgi:hypothetical protein